MPTEPQEPRGGEMQNEDGRMPSAAIHALIDEGYTKSALRAIVYRLDHVERALGRKVSMARRAPAVTQQDMEADR